MPNNTPRNNAQNRAVTRNLVAKHQWQRGGAHEKPYKAKRQQAKQQLKKEIRAGRKSYSDFYCAITLVFRQMLIKSRLIFDVRL